MTTIQFIEWTAVILALIYVVQAIRQQRICFIAAGLSALLYTWVFWTASLYMEAALQLFYLGMAGYGWTVWGRDNSSYTLAVSCWGWRQHGLTLCAVLLISLCSGTLLSRYTDAALPYVDSTTTVAALIATWMVARKILENWLWWIAIDLISIWLYLERGLQASAVLFAGYVLLAIAGYLSWHRQLPESTPSDGSAEHAH